METSNSDAATQVLAIWGAVLSSITFFWTLYKDLLDRAQVKVTAKLRRIGRREGDGQGYAADPGLNVRGLGDELFIVVTVVNVGRRAMNWKGWGGIYKIPVNGHNSFFVSARELPKILNEQEEHSEFTGVDKQIGTGNLKRIKIWDGTGREWYVSRKDMKKLLVDIAKYAEIPPQESEADGPSPGN